MDTDDANVEKLSVEQKRALLKKIIISKRCLDKYPLSYSQEGLWFVHECNRQSSAYNLSFSAKIVGGVDLDKLGKSISLIVKRYDILRAEFIFEDGKTYQKIDKFNEFKIETVDATGMSAEQIRKVMSKEHAKPFDLSKGGLLRATVYCCFDGIKYILITAHHIVLDLKSMEILINDLLLLYNNNLDETILPKIECGYYEYVKWQKLFMKSSEGKKQLEYWKEELKDSKTLINLPFDIDAEVKKDESCEVSFSIGDDLLSKIKSFTLQNNLTPFNFFLGCYLIMLNKFSHDTSISVGMPILGRNKREFENVVGYFANTAVLAVLVDKQQSFLEFLAQIRAKIIQAVSNGDCPLPCIANELHSDGKEDNASLFIVAIAYEKSVASDRNDALFSMGVENSKITFNDFTLESFKIDKRDSPYKLLLMIGEGSDQTVFSWQYDMSKFSRAAIKRFNVGMCTIMEYVLENRDTVIKSIPVITQAQYAQVTGNLKESSFKNTHVLCAVEEQAANHGDKTAIMYGNSKTCFTELINKAYAMANTLAAMIHKGECVPVVLQKSPESVIAMLGIMLSGGVYVPVDCTHPKERIQFIASEVKASVVITEHELGDCFNNIEHVVYIRDLPLDNGKKPRINTDYEDPAYIIFTSGTTGKPKGVVVPYRGMYNMALEAAKALKLRDDSKLLQFASHSFDASVFEVFAALVSGTTLCIPERKGLLVCDSLIDTINEYGATEAVLPPSVLSTLDYDMVPSLRSISSAGEAISSETAQKWAKNININNLYGPTETTVYSSFAELNGAGKVTIGKAIRNTNIYILDEDLNLTPVGVKGEIHISGLGIALGYFNMKELTESKFIPNPFNDGYPKLYKTGDLAMFLPDGCIDYLGRIDDQVKIRGYRIELQEINEDILKNSEVENSVVRVVGDNENKNIVAYVSLHGKNCDTDAIESKIYNNLRKGLPYYMVPGKIMFLDEMPLNVNGKVDIKELPAVDMKKRNTKYVPPETQTEKVICEIIEKVLSVPRAGMEDDFFSLGGNSITAVKAVMEIRRVLGIDIGIKDFFEQKDVRSLTRLVHNGKMNACLYYPIEKTECKTDVPLTYVQKRLWFLSRVDRTGAAFNIPLCADIVGSLNVAYFEKAINVVASRHEILRTRFYFKEGMPYQAVEKSLDIKIDYEDLESSGVSKHNFMKNAVSYKFDLERPPLVKVFIGRLGEKHYVLIVNIHHIVCDGWGVKVLLGELETIYNALLNGREIELPEPAVQYADYAFAEEKAISDGFFEKSLEYWNKQLKLPFGNTQLMPDFDVPAERTYNGRKIIATVNKDITNALTDFSRENGTTLFSIMIAAFSVLLYRYTGEKDVIVGTAVAGRNDYRLNDSIGVFINTVAVRNRIENGITLHEIIKSVAKNVLDGLNNSAVPFEKIVEKINPDRNGYSGNIINVMVNMLNFENSNTSYNFEGLKISEIEDYEQKAKFDMTLYVDEKPDGLKLSLVYNAALYRSKTMQSLLDAFTIVLHEIAENSEMPIDKICLAKLPQKEEKLEDFSDYNGMLVKVANFEYSKDKSRIAVTSGVRAFTYDEIDRCCNTLCQMLKEKGISQKDTLGIYTGRNMLLPVVLTAVIRLGARFCILDRGIPKGKSAAQIVRIPGIKIIQIGEESCLPKNADIVLKLAETFSAKAMTQTDEPAVQSNINAGGYYNFTSGTTGKFKIIENTAAPLAHFLKWYKNEFKLTENDTFAMLAGISHDPILRDILMPQFLGARLAVPPEEYIRNPMRLVGWLKSEKVTVLHITPPLAESFADTGGILLPDLRLIAFSGDTLTESLVERLKKLATNSKFVNFYGLTETPQVMSYYTIPQEHQSSAYGGRIPIGKGIEGVELLVLNNNKNLCACGEIGEIYIKTKYLSEGYFNDRDATAEKYLKLNGKMLYKTGDLGRYMASGNVDFIRRTDMDVNIRGNRIDITEIENSIEICDGVGGVAVSIECENTDRCIVAYVKPKEGAVITSQNILNYLYHALPMYMIPGKIVFVNQIPLTENNKIDYAKLETIGRHRAGTSHSPATETERMLCDIFSKLLNVESVDVETGFFQMGVHSLMLSKAVFLLNEKMHVELNIIDFFTYSNISMLANYIDNSSQAGAEDDNLVRKRQAGIDADKHKKRIDIRSTQ